eukprot:gnl/Chilomastix_caulleri/6905.p1 GENE.gnl/Chilomastix_caulleri/6905~~gnl/Chilomastix_caulleri/6905.p1  ORF type:complete len:90 (-),score=21.33 gnl/Chilomastix_caulleri/6905:39-308(-)
MAMQKKVVENPNIEILWNKQIKEICGDGMRVTHLILKEDGLDDLTIEVGALFYGIGHEPATGFVKDIVRDRWWLYQNWGRLSFHHHIFP